ncbi:zinc finger MYND domain-containing protein 12 isoform X6 [Perognathus longimembris pacificus]|uniref:zinc finger MYND domain-containing protein 12 isoform X6 n=1 Tax=Perognathus longimembris pacificus TaxID=214514 RepID=UPI0020197721|nr:zinc finger MYND domain-containing protein 12 isoform X6 [Perognathus longimembris pacificus]
MDIIYPLAVPKGRRLCCEVCEAPAERVCTACTVTYYCSPMHQRADWVSIHEKICQLLIPLRTSMPFFNSEEERQHGLQQLQQRQKHLIEFCYTVAQKYLFEGKYEDAVPAALHSLRFRRNVYGLSSVELVPAYLLLAEASLGMGRIVQAEEYLSQAQWTVLKSTNCSNATHSLLHRNLGLLYIAKKNYDEARFHLANDVSDIWYTYVNDRYQTLLQVRAQKPDLLGKRLVNDTGLDEAQDAEAIGILTSVLSIRESTFAKTPKKTILVLKILAMLYYLMMNSSKAKEYGTRALKLAQEQLDDLEQKIVQDILNVISAEDHPADRDL